MTDTNGTPPNEEPTKTDNPSIQERTIDELPIMHITPNIAEEATQTLAADTVVDASATMTDIPAPVGEVTQATSFDKLAASSPSPQAAPSQTYEQFGTPGPSGQPLPDPNVIPQQPGVPAAFYAQSAYAPQPDNPAAFYSQNPYVLQPGQPFPGQFGAPVPLVKRRRTALWIAAAVVAMLLIAGGTTFALVASQQHPTNTPTQALQQFCHGYKTLNAQEIYDGLSTASKGGTSLAQIQQGFDLLKSMSSLVQISDCQVSDVQQNGSKASGKITLTETVSFLGTSTANPIPISLGLVLDNNTWKVDASTITMNLTIPTLPAFPTFPPDLLTPTTPSY